MRSVHLFDPSRAGWAAASALCAAREGGGGSDVVVLVGGEDAARRAAACGVAWDLRIAAPAGRAWLAWRSARAALRGIGRVDRVVGWSPDTMRLAWLSARSPTLITAARGAWYAPRPQAVAARSRDSFDARWRLGPGTSVVGILADGSRSVNCVDVSFLLGVLTLAGWPSVGVIWRGSARSIERGERMISMQGRRWRIIIEDEPLTRWIGACDVGVSLSASGANPHAVAWARARRTPVVVEEYGSSGDDGRAHEWGVRYVRAGRRHACAGAALDFLEHPIRDARSAAVEARMSASLA